MPLFLNGWIINHDGYNWWARRKGDEPFCCDSYLQAAQHAAFNA